MPFWQILCYTHTLFPKSSLNMPNFLKQRLKYWCLAVISHSVILHILRRWGGGEEKEEDSPGQGNSGLEFF